MVREPTTDEWAVIRHKYEHTGEPVADICHAHRTTPNTLRDRVRRWGWTPRRAPIPRAGPPPLPAPMAAALTPAPLALAPDDAARLAAPVDEAIVPRADDATPVGVKLQAALARIVPAIEATVARLAAGSVHTAEMERAGRALSSLTRTRTLRELTALAGQYPAPNPDDDRGPDDPDEFILEIARRLDAFAAAHPDERAKAKDETP